ncbi:hypothetical protein ACIPJI_36010, partial [Streptomyces sp. NPDC086835]
VRHPAQHPEGLARYTTPAITQSVATLNKLTDSETSLNRAPARLRHPVEHGVASLKTWHIFQHARCSPTWLTSAAKAVLTLDRHR